VTGKPEVSADLRADGHRSTPGTGGDQRVAGKQQG
jgi:hypothetical protein